MTRTEKILACIVAVLILWAAYGMHHDSMLKAQLATSDKAAKDAISAINADHAEETALNRAKIADLTALKQKTITIKQVVHAVPQVFDLPSPVEQVTAKQAEAANAADPTAPAIHADDVVIPQADAKPLFDAGIAGQECKVNLDQAKSDLDACQKISDVKATQITARDQVIKGGTKWARFKTGSKWAAFGGLITAGAIEYFKQK